MNERAGIRELLLRPLWHVEHGQALFAGPLGHNAGHSHSVPVFVAGLYEPFSIRIADGEWKVCRTAVIPAGVKYEFDMRGAPISVLYVEPTTASPKALAPLVRNTWEESGALMGLSGELSLLRELYEDRGATDWIGSAVQDILDHSRRRAPEHIDNRVARVVEQMYSSYVDLAPVARVAASAGLSSWRFQHVFSREIGVPFRRFRAWCRMRVAIRHVLQGNNYTEAAHAAGYSDQPHFCRDFRRTFGAPASPSLAAARQQYVPIARTGS